LMSDPQPVPAIKQPAPSPCRTLTRMSSSVYSPAPAMMHYSQMLLPACAFILSSSQNLGLLHDAHSSPLFHCCLHFLPVSSQKSLYLSVMSTCAISCNFALSPIWINWSHSKQQD
jgi:hypothetical protein